MDRNTVDVSSFKRSAAPARVRPSRPVWTRWTCSSCSRSGSCSPSPPKAAPTSAGDVQALAAQIRVLRARLGHLAPLETTRTILVTSPQPGDGQTTVACNLAASLALSADAVGSDRVDLTRAARVGLLTGVAVVVTIGLVNAAGALGIALVVAVVVLLAVVAMAALAIGLPAAGYVAVAQDDQRAARSSAAATCGSDSGTITGLSLERARELVVQLNAGALPQRAREPCDRVCLGRQKGAEHPLPREMHRSRGGVHEMAGQRPEGPGCRRARVPAGLGAGRQTARPPYGFRVDARRLPPSDAGRRPCPDRPRRSAGRAGRADAGADAHLHPHGRRPVLPPLGPVPGEGLKAMAQGLTSAKPAAAIPARNRTTVVMSAALLRSAGVRRDDASVLVARRGDPGR